MNKKVCIIATLLTLTFLICSKSEEVESTEQVPEVVEVLPEPDVTKIVNSISESASVAATPPEPVLIDLGEYRLTAYCSCSKCCEQWASLRPLDENGEPIVYGASGKVLQAGYSIATDQSVIPYGTIVVINGREYESMDRGGAINGNRIDVYFSNHEEALQFGVQYANVFIKE